MSNRSYIGGTPEGESFDSFMKDVWNVRACKGQMRCAGNQSRLIDHLMQEYGFHEAEAVQEVLCGYPLVADGVWYGVEIQGIQFVWWRNYELFVN